MKKHPSLLQITALLTVSIATAVWAMPLSASTPTYAWGQDQAFVPMGPAAEWFCGFKHLQGKFEGGGEKIGLELGDLNGVRSWTMKGKSNQHAVYGEAFCIPAATELETFSWIQGQGSVSLGATSEKVCVLTGVSGQFEGEGEQVEVWAKDGQWYLGGKSNKHDVGATAACFRSDATQTFHSWNQDEEPKILGNAANRQCFLLSMSGKFEGKGERLSLTFNGGQWRLGGASNQHAVQTTAVCVVD